MFPIHRMRRIRESEILRDMVRETALGADDLVMPLFVAEGLGGREEIRSMPGQFRHSLATLVEECSCLFDAGIRAIILFGIPGRKDTGGSGAWSEDGIIQKALAEVRREVPDMLVITDICLCEYTSHGRVGAIRSALDENGFAHIPILSYAAKYASAYYGPFRDAAESAPQFGDRRSYQMDPANLREALREVELDILEGADIVMVKPALAYLDVIRAVKQKFDLPVAAYNVSGEYAMIKAAAEKGWLDERRIVLETLTSIKRAGADIILTYFAADVAQWLST
jgi:porphobilinogen synthase